MKARPKQVSPPSATLEKLGVLGGIFFPVHPDLSVSYPPGENPVLGHKADTPGRALPQATLLGVGPIPALPVRILMGTAPDFMYLNR